LTDRGANEKLRAALTALGVDKAIIEKLLYSPDLPRATMSVYSRGPARPDTNDFALAKLPEFLAWFEYTFPNGVLRWDPEHEGGSETVVGFALGVTFSLLEDDQGARIVARPNELDEESYHRKLEEFSNNESDAVKVQKILSGL
jgi:hypothetical protein